MDVEDINAWEEWGALAEQLGLSMEALFALMLTVHSKAKEDVE